MLQHIVQIHRHGTAGWDSEGLTVDVPAEEMMLHQHVLHAFLQRPLLLLLGKRTGEKHRGNNAQGILHQAPTERGD